MHARGLPRLVQFLVKCIIMVRAPDFLFLHEKAFCFKANLGGFAPDYGIGQTEELA